MTSKIAGSEIALTGTGEPGSELQIVVDGVPVETVGVDENGRWAVTTALAEPGQYAIGLSALDETGSVVAMATAITLDVAAPDTDVARMTDIAEPDVVAEPDVAEAPETVVAPEPAEAGSPATQEPSSSLAVDAMDEPVAPGFVTFSGTGPAGSQVTVNVDEMVAGRALVEPDDTWVFVTRIGETGVYSVSATDETGLSSAPVLLTVTDTVPEQAVVEDTVVTDTVSAEAAAPSETKTSDLAATGEADVAGDAGIADVATDQAIGSSRRRRSTRTVSPPMQAIRTPLLKSAASARPVTNWPLRLMETSSVAAKSAKIPRGSM